MRILLTGGTGFIGSELIKHLTRHQVVLLTRDIKAAKQVLYHADLGNITYIDSLTSLNNLNEFDAVINLAGEPIADKKWSKEQKSAICDSRWQITEQLTSLIKNSNEPPAVFISGSAVGFYGDQASQPFDESLNTPTPGFTHSVCAKWEEIANQAKSDSTRVCIVRTGVVIGHGGALQKMLPPFKLGLGSVLGQGVQYMPWIHIQDMIRGIHFLLTTPSAQGIFNFCAPHPVSNHKFSSILAKALRRPLWIKTPKWFFTLVMGESSCLLFDSIRAKPKHLTELGFNFNYSRIEPAINNIIQHKQ